MENMDAKQTVIININNMSDTIGIKRMSFESIWSYSLDQLRTIQDSLIPWYNETINKENNK